MMTWLTSLLGHPEIKDVEINDLGDEPKAKVILNNGITLDVELLGSVGCGIPQPRGGNRLYVGSEASFNFCFKAYLNDKE
jgi:hypothetical protein